MKKVCKALPAAALMIMGATLVAAKAQGSNQGQFHNRGEAGSAASMSATSSVSASSAVSTQPNSTGGNAESSVLSDEARDRKVVDLYNSANVFMKEHNYAKALPILQQAAAVGPNLNEAIVHNALGLVYENLDDVDLAIAEYKKTFELKPDLEIGKHNLSNMYCRKAKRISETGNLDEAETLLKEAIRLNPNQPMFHNNLGSAMQSKGDLEGAIVQYNQALALDPHMELATLNIAKCYVNVGKFDQGKMFFQKFLTDHPDSEKFKEAQDRLEYLKHKTGLPEDDNGAPDYYRSAIRKEAVKWPPEMMPLKVYIDPGDTVRGYRPYFHDAVVRAMNDWSQATRTKITWVAVPQSDQADIVCSWAQDNTGFKNHITDPNEQGEVSSYLTFVRDGQRYIRHVNLAIATFNSISGRGLSDGEARNVALHESGHALGIIGHSPNFHDIMFFITNPGGGFSERGLTARDVATINLLYPDLQR